METDIELIEGVMLDFTKRTGLDPVTERPHRYLWTDAFAVCDFFELHHRTKNERYLKLALALVDQVHLTLGRHRHDDCRTGWISGLNEKDAKEHPTRGGLRIGKSLQERRTNEPPDAGLEWDQDGQYYHYLTKWMHALARVCRITGEPKYGKWAIELAKVAHAAFTYSSRSSIRKQMYWKMSIDLSRPLVASMGLHDPLDGYVTYLELKALASDLSTSSDKLDLNSEIAEMASICSSGSWVTDDPLGIGGLLFDASRIGQLITLGASGNLNLLKKVLDSALHGLESFSSSGSLQLPTRYRLPFREIGLSIGLKAVERLHRAMETNPSAFGPDEAMKRRTDVLLEWAPIGVEIERFWKDPSNRLGSTWLEHEDINAVMLATSLATDSFLSI